MDPMAVPSPAVVKAFGIEGEPDRISGGRGLCYRVGQAVLRPSDNDEESRWIADFLTRLPSSDYRVARPIPVRGEEHEFVFEGWTAWSFVTGVAGPEGKFAEILQTSRAFHADITRLDVPKPAFLQRRLNRWGEADLVTWEEKRIEDVDNVNVGILQVWDKELTKLKELKRPLVDGQKCQVIHGDLTGNVLFEDGLPPGIIDVTPYWRPAEYAEAIVVADGLVWHNEGQELIQKYGESHLRMQLLVRAVYWRCLTFAIDSDMAWVEQHIPLSNFSAAVRAIEEAMKRVSGTMIAQI